MNPSYVSSGKHMICDLKNIQNMDALHSLDSLRDMFDTICAKHDFHVLEKTSHSFEPHGHTILYLLSESHISIHTFPEKQYAAVDIYTCRDYPDNRVYDEIYDYLVRVLACDRENPIIINRG
jgi:S-adenosylmethionine decarboxylase